MENFFDFLQHHFYPNPEYMHKDSDISVHIEKVMIRVPDGCCMQKHFAQDLGVPFEIPLECVLQDPQIVRTARVSTGNDKKAMTDRAFQTLSLLYEGRHITPFESVMFQFDITCPIQFADYFFAQFGSFNELSGRYSEFDTDRQGFYIPPELSKNSEILNIVMKAHEKSLNFYDYFICETIAREQARFVLPYSFMTKFRWTVSLRHILEFLSLERYHLVPEIFWDMRDYIFTSIVRDWVPGTYELFQEIPRVIHTNFSDEHGFQFPNVEFSREVLSRVKKEKGIFNTFVGEVSVFESFGNEELALACLATCPNPQQGLGHAGMTMYFNVPIFVFRQIRRHRNGVWSLIPPDFDLIVSNEDFYVPLQFCFQIGSSMSYTFHNVPIERNTQYIDEHIQHIREMISVYKILRRFGVAQEHASCVLPYTFRIESVYTANLVSLINFFSLRLDTHAQRETRACIEPVYAYFASRFPLSNDIFLRYMNFGKFPLFEK